MNRRLAVIEPAAVRYVMRHPARGRKWSVRELSAALGCSVGALSHMRTGARATIPAELAGRFAEAVGVETAVLFEAPTEDRPTWGRGVRALRGLYRLSVEDLATQAGATEDMITRLEAGDRRFSDSLQQRIARVLRTDPGALFPTDAMAVRS